MGLERRGGVGSGGRGVGKGLKGRRIGLVKVEVVWGCILWWWGRDGVSPVVMGKLVMGRGGKAGALEEEEEEEKCWWKGAVEGRESDGEGEEEEECWGRERDGEGGGGKECWARETGIG